MAEDFTIPSGFPGVVSLGRDRDERHGYRDNLDEVVLLEGQKNLVATLEKSYEIMRELGNSRLEYERNKHEVQRDVERVRDEVRHEGHETRELIRSTVAAAALAAANAQIAALQAQINILTAPVPTPAPVPVA